MTRKILGHGMKYTRIALEVAGVLVGIMLFVMIVFLGRLSRGPIDFGFATHYIEKALNDPATGYSVRLGQVILDWPEVRGSLMLDLRNIRLIKERQTVLSVGRAKLGLSGIWLMAGQIAPVSIAISHPTLHLVRTEEGDVRLSLEQQPEAEAPETPAEEAKENPFMDIIKTLSAPPGAAGASSPLSHLQSMRVSDASMIVEDHTLGITWFLGHIDLQFAKDQEGLAVTVGARIPGGRKGDSFVHADAIYRRDADDFYANIHLQDFDPRVISRKIDFLSPLNTQEVYFDGEANAVIDSKLNVRKANMTLSSVDGVLDLPGIYAQPFAFQNFELQISYDGDAGKAALEKAFVQAQDVQATLSGNFAVGKDAIWGPLTLNVPSVTHAKIKALWPQTMNDGSAHAWVVQRLSDGSASNVAASVDIVAKRLPEEGWQLSATNIIADFDLSGMTVDYRDPLLPVRQASGHGHFADDTLDIGVDSGAIGDMKISKGRVVIDHVIEPGVVGTANITTHLDGKLTSVFDYIKSEPINVDVKKIGLDMGRIKGLASLDVGVSFPTSKHLLASQVAVKINGPLKDVVLPHLVKTMDLASPSITLNVAGGMAGAKGKGKLDGDDIDFEWQEYLESKDKPFSMRVTASGESSDAMRAKLGMSVDKWVKGTMPVKIVYTEYPGRKSEVAVDANAGPGMLMIAPIEYVKAAGAAATLKCKALLQDGHLVEVSDLDVKAADIDIENAVLKFADKDSLRSAKVARAKVGENDGALDVQADKDGDLTVNFRGAFFDARPFLARRKKEADMYNGPAVSGTIDAAQLRTRDGHVIRNAKVRTEVDRQGFINRMDVDAVAGNGPLTLRLGPDGAGNVTLSMKADDAGATLRAYSIYDNVVGGKLKVTGRSKDPQGIHDIKGAAQITDFRVIKAPALAQLLSVLSPMNLPALLNNEQGIGFSKLEAKFLWAQRRKGDVYVITDGRTSGSSLGLTFNGRIDKQKDEINITGDVVPVSEVNGLIGNIPLVGDILTGGKNGALFAATYALTGPIASPKVSVNPLSVLTPGILRKIFFEGGN